MAPSGRRTLLRVSGKRIRVAKHCLPFILNQAGARGWFFRWIINRRARADRREMPGCQPDEVEMTKLIADILLMLTGAYLALGLICSGPILWVGVRRMDPRARDGTWGFRLLILPGVLVFWPWLLGRWWRGAGEPPVEDTAHRRAAGEASRSAANPAAGDGRTN